MALDLPIFGSLGTLLIITDIGGDGVSSHLTFLIPSWNQLSLECGCVLFGTWQMINLYWIKHYSLEGSSKPEMKCI